jgi:hypothetical protein
MDLWLAATVPAVSDTATLMQLNSNTCMINIMTHLPQKEARDATEELARANSRYQQLSEQLQAERGHIAGLEVGSTGTPVLQGQASCLALARG